MEAILKGVEKRANEGKFTHTFHISEQLSSDVIKELKKLGYDIDYTAATRYTYYISW